MKIILVKERGQIRILENKGNEKKTIDGNELALRSRLTSGDIKYYELDYEERQGTSLEGYVAALNMYPNLLNDSKLIKEI